MFHAQKTPSDQVDLKTSFFHQEFEGDLRIKHAVSSVVDGNRLHTHNFYEVLLCLSDNCHFLINDVVYRLNAQDLILLNSSDIHGVIFDGTTLFDRCVIEFDPAYAQDMCKYYDILSCFEALNHPTVLSLDVDQFNPYLTLFQKLLLLEKPSKRPEQPLMKKLAFTELLMMVNTFARCEAKTDRQPEEVHIQRIQTIISYIKDHLSGDISSNDLAKLVYLSPSYFNTMFRAAMGYSVNQYIMNQRILMATKLLEQPLSVQEISERCGFNDYAHFIRTFKKCTGLPPGQYRKKFLSHDPDKFHNDECI